MMVFSPEVQKGSLEMLILALGAARPRHGYEIGKLIEGGAGGRLSDARQHCPSAFRRLVACRGTQVSSAIGQARPQIDEEVASLRRASVRPAPDLITPLVLPMPCRL